MVSFAGANLVQWQAGSLGLWELALRLEPGNWSSTERGQEPVFVGACLVSRTIKADLLLGGLGTCAAGAGLVLG